MLLKGILIFVHIVVSVFLVLVVLLQTGKRADLAGAFGGGGSQTAFGARGAATVLSKLTTTFAVIFMVTSLSLAMLSSGRQKSSGSVLEGIPAPEEQTAPAVPGSGGPTDETPAAADPTSTETSPEATSGGAESPADDPSSPE